ncbi:hypothetical protein [Burkholderia ubonensis]|uniref:hypothetical protein n=1 Tax=Burkholderia ubonensis TaxID=101571 RepID=UPI000B1AE659|nr:hypothetical protein [Burkholderia ubonensis]
MIASLFSHWVSSRPEAHPTLYQLSEDFWAEAALLGAARLQSNDGRRDDRRDRAEHNAQIDLMGSASEVLLFRMLWRFGEWLKKNETQSSHAEEQRSAVRSGLMYMRRSMFVQGGGGMAQGADFLSMTSGHIWAIDAKSYDFSPNKRLFAINQQKHRELAEENPDYFCLLCPPLAKIAYVTMVPYKNVDEWETRILRPTNPDPAKVCDLNEFMLRFLERTLVQCREEVSIRRHLPQEILVRTEPNMPAWQRVMQYAPAIGELSGGDSYVFRRYIDRMLN